MSLYHKEKQVFDILKVLWNINTKESVKIIFNVCLLFLRTLKSLSERMKRFPHFQF